MREQSIVLRRLVESVDEFRRFCTDAGLHATRPWVKHTLEQVAASHWHIAVGLCARITTMGPRLARGHRYRRTWRMTWSTWVAHNAFDPDFAYVRQAQKRADRLTRRFVRAVQRLPDGDTRWHLARCVYEIDHARATLMWSVARVRTGIDARRAVRCANKLVPAAVRPEPRRDGALGIKPPHPAGEYVV